MNDPILVCGVYFVKVNGKPERRYGPLYMARRSTIFDEELIRDADRRHEELRRKRLGRAA
jgi:hypothetical protein